MIEPEIPQYDDELYGLASPGLTREGLVRLIARAHELLADDDDSTKNPLVAAIDRLTAAITASSGVKDHHPLNQFVGERERINTSPPTFTTMPSRPSTLNGVPDPNLVRADAVPSKFFGSSDGRGGA